MTLAVYSGLFLVFYWVPPASGQLEGALGIHEQRHHAGGVDELIAGVHVLGLEAVVDQAGVADADLAAQAQELLQLAADLGEGSADVNALGGVGLAQLHGLHHQDNGGRVALLEGVEAHDHAYGQIVGVGLALEQGDDEIGILHGDILLNIWSCLVGPRPGVPVALDESMVPHWPPENSKKVTFLSALLFLPSCDSVTDVLPPAGYAMAKKTTKRPQEVSIL